MTDMEHRDKRETPSRQNQWYFFNGSTPPAADFNTPIEEILLKVEGSTVSGIIVNWHEYDEVELIKMGMEELEVRGVVHENSLALQRFRERLGI